MSERRIETYRSDGSDGYSEGTYGVIVSDDYYVRVRYAVAQTAKAPSRSPGREKRT